MCDVMNDALFPRQVSNCTLYDWINKYYVMLCYVTDHKMPNKSIVLPDQVKLHCFINASSRPFSSFPCLSALDKSDCYTGFLKGYRMY